MSVIQEMCLYSCFNRFVWMCFNGMNTEYRIKSFYMFVVGEVKCINVTKRVRKRTNYWVFFWICFACGFFFLLLSNRNPSVCEWTGEIYDTNQANHIQLCHSNLVKIIWRDHYNIWWAECSTSTGSMLHLVQFIRIYLYGLCFVSVILIINAKGKWITFPIKFGNSMKTGIVVVWCIATNMNNV